MLDVMFSVILVGAGLVMIAVLSSVLAFRFGAPLLFIFLGLGLLFGEDGLGIHFNDASLAYFVGSLALSLILFDSGFCTRLSSFRAAALPAVTLASLGVVLTAALVGVAAHVLIGFSLPEAFLIGAIVSSTDAAAVFFLLRVGRIQIRERVRSTLEIESGANDPMAIFLTIVLVEWIATDRGGAAGQAGDLLIMFARQMGLGVALGLLGGLLIVRIVNTLRLEAGLYPVLVLAASLVLFGSVGMLGGSGFLAVYVAGLYAGNQRIAAKGALRRFQEGLTWFAQITMFLVLGLLATPSQFPAIVLPALAIALVLTLIARPVAVWLCLLPFRYQPNETAFISWVGLRGAVSILLGILPLAAGLENGHLFFNTAFIIVLASLLVQGWTVRPVARWLRLIVPQSIGPVERLDLDLPGAAHHELVAYRVVPGSPVASGERIPRWARPSLVIRDGQSIRHQFAGKLRPGDRVYIFTAPRYLRLLDRLFASPAKLTEDDKDYFGEFVVHGNHTIGELAENYSLPVEPFDPRQTIDGVIRGRLGGAVEVGDRIGLGDIELVVRQVDDAGNIESVGLVVQPIAPKPERIWVFLNARKLIARLKARRQRRSQREQR
ncbi:MAG: potassium/proton antiporter [Rhodospirillales bacterium]|nr:potassium/proton antiporter [Rhodospirillales bacterium]